MCIDSEKCILRHQRIPKIKTSKTKTNHKKFCERKNLNIENKTKKKKKKKVWRATLGIIAGKKAAARVPA